MKHAIYNLTFDSPSFSCAGYEFHRVADYDNIVGELFVRGRVSRTTTVAASGASPGQWQVTQQMRPGRMLVTYEAAWMGPEPEPDAVIYRDATRIFDVILLWSLWGGEHASTGKRAPYLSSMFAGDAYYRSKEELRAGIDSLAATLTAQQSQALALNPGLFLLLESYCTDIANFQTLFISPVIDALASQQEMQPLSEADTNRLTKTKEELQAVLEAQRPPDEDTDDLWRNVIGPFVGAVGGLGRPAAADKVRQLLGTSPALAGLQLETRLIESHARAFNQFRNATLHYAGLPRDIRLLFGGGRTVRIKRTASREMMLRALTYYNQAFQDFVLLHYTLQLGIDSDWGRHRSEHTLREFFVDGRYNDHDWVASAFMDQVVGEPVAIE